MPAVVLQRLLACIGVGIGLLLAPGSLALAGCLGPYADCWSADDAWPEPFQGSGLLTPSIEPVRSTFSAGLALGYLRNPVNVVAAAPDPYGDQIRVVGDWLPARALFSMRWRDLEFGAVLPFGFGASGTGLAGVTTRTEASSLSGMGAPRLAVRFARRFGNFQLAATEQLVLPLAATGTFLGSNGFGYAPALLGQWDGARAWLSASLGLRLARSSAFGPSRFGSSAALAMNTGVHVSQRVKLFAETLVLPALNEDDFSYPSAKRYSWRIPAELLLGARLDTSQLRVSLGAGTSLPLTREHVEYADGSSATTSRYAAPPSPALRIELRVETHWQ